MKAILKMEMTRAFRNKRMIFSLLIGNGIVLMYYLFSVTGLIKSFYDIAESSEKMPLLSANQCFIGTSDVNYTSLFFFIIPILAAIPYGDSLFWDKREGYINHILMKTNRIHYLIAKLITLFVSGGVIATMPLVLSYILAILSLPSIRPAIESFTYNVKGVNLFSDLFYSDYTFVYIIIFILVDFIIFGMINCLCMVFTYWEDNRFAIVLTPFILCYGLHMAGQYFIGTDKSPFTFAKLNYVTSESFVYMLIELFMVMSLCLLTLRRRKGDVL